MAPDPVPPGTVRLTLTGDPTPEQALKAARLMLRILRDIERSMKAAGAIPKGPPIKWKLDMRTVDDGATPAPEAR